MLLIIQIILLYLYNTIFNLLPHSNALIHISELSNKNLNCALRLNKISRHQRPKLNKVNLADHL